MIGQRYRGIVILLILFVFAGQGESQKFLRTNGKAIVNENNDTILLRGMGLGGWMLQEGYMLQTSDFANAQYQIKDKITQLIGKDNTETFYDLWLSNHMTRRDVEALKEWGFNSVRLPMHYNLYTLPIEAEPVPGNHTWIEKGFEMTDSLVEWCRDNDMYIILDLHAAPGGQGYDQGISDYNPEKPSLWESEANKQKTVALWKRIAERYADEPVIAGYDLINEPNWNLPNNAALKNLYSAITDSIREVDTKHIIFIEGNWFANDFTGLTPPWDDNMVYSPHKYWSFNDQGSIQWVLNIRNAYNVPLYFGESGENSNVWFRNAIKLFEDNGIGWAWWPMKKVESISAPLSVTKTGAYETLLEYWKGNGPKPDTSFAKTTLYQLAEDLKFEHCRFQKDVVDAMFRQVQSEQTIPFAVQVIPGTVYATDFSMGINGRAYSDNEVANYHVSTENYTAWNNGWAYRNDGVDIEPSSDQVNSNGYNVGWIEDNEWIQYDVSVEESGFYDIDIRLAAATAGGKFHFRIADAPITEPFSVQSTGGWTTWSTGTIGNVYLHKEENKLIFYSDKGGFNVSSFTFKKSSGNTPDNASFISAFTDGDQKIKVSLSKWIQGPITSSSGEFSVTANGNPVPTDQISLNPDNPRVIEISLDYSLRFDDIVRISYAGSSILAEDGTSLSHFTNKLVQNNLPVIHAIPGKIEAEDFIFQQGIQLEDCTDTGNGQNIGYLDAGDFIDYLVDIDEPGNYIVEFRTAGLDATGRLRMSLIDETGHKTVVSTHTFPATGGWQNWNTTSREITLPSGHFTLNLEITQAPFNINWFSFSSVNPPVSNDTSYVKVYPNPFSHMFHVDAIFKTPHKLNIDIFNSTGQKVSSEKLGINDKFDHRIPTSHWPTGNYFVLIFLENGDQYEFKVLKIE